MHLRASGYCRFTPGALAPVRVLVSRSISTYSAPSVPLASTSRFHQHGLYERSSLCVIPQRLGDPRVVPCFRWQFSVGMSPSKTPGSRPAAPTQSFHRPHWPSTFSDGLGTSVTLHPPILVEESISRLTTVRMRYNLPTCSPPCRSRPGSRPAYGDFYFRAFDGLVTRTVAGYHYSGNWASSTDGIYTRKNAN